MTNAPIAVVTHRDDPNRFHRYVEEILLVEGYPWFRVHDLADDPPDPTALRAAAVVVVAAVTLTAEQEEELAALTAAGARVLLLRPGHRLARAFGLEPFEALEPLSSSGPLQADGPLILRGMTDATCRPIRSTRWPPDWRPATCSSTTAPTCTRGRVTLRRWRCGWLLSLGRRRPSRP